MKSFFTTARTTGLFYFGLLVAGIVAFLLVRSNLYVQGDAWATATNFVNQESLARFGVMAEVALAGFQAFAAVWFFKLFRNTSSFAAGALAAFGMVNAVAILLASAFWLSAINVAIASDQSVSFALNQAATTQLLFGVHETIWTVASLFFGLWLLPMGYLVRRSRMPSTLGWLLIAGGVGYVLSVVAATAMPQFGRSFADLLTLPATAGELWMIGYLLFKK